MNYGILIWDACAGRPDIRFCDGAYFGGLHCGKTLEALIQGKWKPARIEFSHSKDKWYLIGPAGYCDNILSLPARI